MENFSENTSEKEKCLLVCPSCPKKFATNWIFSRHISAVHENCSEDDFICFWCNKTFHQKSNLSRHIWSIHQSRNEEDCLVCEWCGKKFHQKYNLSKHLSTVHQDQNSRSKNFVCTWCDRSYYQSSHLSRHILAVHESSPTKKSFACRWCRKRFDSKSHLTRHVLPNHPNNQDKNRYICEWCGKKFSQKYHLTRHRVTVHQKSEHSFICEECGKAFNWKENLANHIRTHEARRNKLLKCETCDTGFACKRSLMKHNRNQHGLITSDEELEHFECNECSVKLESKDTLRNHIRRIHSFDQQEPRPKKVSHLRCIFCKKDHVNKKSLGEHYEKNHDVKLEFEYLIFSSIEEFEKWLRPCYRIRAKWKTPLYIGKTFCCHRSGFYEDSCKKNNQERKRLLKVSGSKKLQGFCPGEVILRQRYSDGSCLITHQKVHIGHEVEAANEFQNVYLSKHQKNMVARQLAEGVPKETILQKLIDKNQDRCDALKLQDIKNIATALGIENPLSTHNDPVFVDSFIAQHRDSVLLYKIQSKSDPNFILIFQDEFQRKCLEKHSHNVVAFDPTYGTNPNNFVLHTMLVIDADNEGIPVAFMISNKGDQDVVDTFVRCIKDRVGIINARTVLSDIDMVYYNAWIKIMNIPEFSLYPTWQVRKRWKQQLDKLVITRNANSTGLKFTDCKQLKDELWLKLWDLANELDPTLFPEKLSLFLSMADSNPVYKPFMEYFRERYTGKTSFWALCYRMPSGVNCDMYVESFHRVVKYKIARGKKIETLAAGLYCISEYVKYRNKNPDIKVERRPSLTNKLRELCKRHREAENYAEKNSFTIVCVDDHTWQVGSFHAVTDGIMEMYSVVKVSMKECASAAGTCRLTCQLCHCCIHDYLCSCPDNAVSNNMCKHIHALSLFLKGYTEGNIITPSPIAVSIHTEGNIITPSPIALNLNTEGNIITPSPIAISIHTEGNIITPSPIAVSIPSDIEDIPVDSVDSSELIFSCENNDDEEQSLKNLREKVANDFDQVKEMILNTITPDDEERWQSLYQQFIRPLGPHLEAMRKNNGKFDSP